MSEGENYKESNRVEREVYLKGEEGNPHKNGCPSGTNLYDEYIQNTEANMWGYQLYLGMVLVVSATEWKQGLLDELE